MIWLAIHGSYNRNAQSKKHNKTTHMPSHDMIIQGSMYCTGSIQIVSTYWLVCIQLHLCVPWQVDTTNYFWIVCIYHIPFNCRACFLASPVNDPVVVSGATMATPRSEVSSIVGDAQIRKFPKDPDRLFNVKLLLKEDLIHHFGCVSPWKVLAGETKKNKYFCKHNRMCLAFASDQISIDHLATGYSFNGCVRPEISEWQHPWKLTSKQNNIEGLEEDVRFQLDEF